MRTRLSRPLEVLRRRWAVLAVLLSALTGTAVYAQDPATENFLRGLSGTRRAVAEVVLETVKETNAKIVTLGSWVSGSTYQDPLLKGTSDHDMRLLMPSGSTEEAAQQAWRQTRDVIAAKIRARFPDTATADKVLASINLYPPDEVLEGIDDATEALTALKNSGINPNLGNAEVEGLWGKGSKAFRDAYEAKTGRLIYAENGVVRSGFADLLPLGETRGIYTIGGSANSASQFLHKVVEAGKAGDARTVRKQLERLNTSLRKARSLAGLQQRTYFDDILKHLNGFGSDVEALQAEFRGNTALADQISQALKKAELDAELLKRFAQSSNPRDVKLLGEMLEEGTGRWARVKASLGEASAHVPWGTLMHGLMAFFVYLETADISSAAGRGDAEQAMEKILSNLSFAASIPAGILSTLVTSILEDAKDAGYSMVARFQDCEDLIAGIYEVKGREDVSGAQRAETSIDALARGFTTEDQVRGVVALHARNASRRGAGDATARADEAVEAQLNARCGPNIVTKWRQRRAALIGEAAAQLLGAEAVFNAARLTATAVPEPVPLASDVGLHGDVTVQARLGAEAAPLTRALADYAATLSSLGGESREVAVSINHSYVWRLDGREIARDSKMFVGVGQVFDAEAARRDITLTTSGDHAIEFQYTLEVTVNSTADDVFAAKRFLQKTFMPRTTVRVSAVADTKPPAGAPAPPAPPPPVPSTPPATPQAAPATPPANAQKPPTAPALPGQLAPPIVTNANVLVAAAVLREIRQFQGGKTCFGERVQLGDAAIFRDAIDKLTVVGMPGERPRHFDYKQGGFFGLRATPAPEMQVPFDINGPLSKEDRQALYHETVHQIEYLYGVKGDNGKPGAERNSDYTGDVIKALINWEPNESALREGTPMDPTRDETRIGLYRELEAALRAAKKKWNPDPELGDRSGFHVEFGEIQALYLSGACDKEGRVKALAEEYAGLSKPVAPPPPVPSAPPANPKSSTTPPADAPNAADAKKPGVTKPPTEKPRPPLGRGEVSPASAGVAPPSEATVGGSWLLQSVNDDKQVTPDSSRDRNHVIDIGGSSISMSCQTRWLAPGQVITSGNNENLKYNIEEARTTAQWAEPPRTIAPGQAVPLKWHLESTGKSDGGCFLGNQTVKLFERTGGFGIYGGTDPVIQAGALFEGDAKPGETRQLKLQYSGPGGSVTRTYTYAWSSGPAPAVPAPPAAKPVTVTISLSGGSRRVAIGQTLAFRALVSSPGGQPPPTNLVYRWQPNPEVAFTPFEGPSNGATGRFTAIGRTKVWVQVLRPAAGGLSSLAESEQIEIDVVPPELKLGFSPADPYPGQVVRVTASEAPPAGDAVTYWWEYAGSAIGPGAEADERVYTFRPKDTKPVKVTAHAKAKDGGTDLGSKEIVITARAHDLKVTGPTARGVKPQIWNPTRGGLEDVERQIAVFQEVSLRVDVTPAPINQPLRYQWAIAPDGCSISNPISQEPTISCSQTGSYTATVTATDAQGATLGSGSGQIPITISQADLQASQKQADAAKQATQADQVNRDTARRLRAEGQALQQQNELREAVAKYRESLTYVPDPALETYIAQVEGEALRQEKAAQQAGGQAAQQEQARRDTARRLRAEGQALQQQNRLREAAARYRESLKHVPDPSLESYIAQVEAEALRQERAAAQAAKPAPTPQPPPAPVTASPKPTPPAPVTATPTAPAPTPQPAPTSMPAPKPAPSKPAPPPTSPSPAQAPAPRPAPPAATQGCTLSGDWDATEEGVTFTLSLRQNGTSLSGTLAIKDPSIGSGSTGAGGSLSGRDVRIVARNDEGEMVFAGSVSADCRVLSVSVTSDGETHPMTFRKR